MYGHIYIFREQHVKMQAVFKFNTHTHARTHARTHTHTRARARMHTYLIIMGKYYTQLLLTKVRIKRVMLIYHEPDA